MECSGKSLEYFDPDTNTKYIPYVIEPSLGADRVTLAFLCEAYEEEEIAEGDVRTVMHLHPAIAPVKAAVLPLSKKLSEQAREVYAMLAKHFNVEYDEQVRLVKDTADRTKSVHLSALHTILTHWKKTAV